MPNNVKQPSRRWPDAAPPTQHGQGQRGLTLIEVLIAMLLVLVVALGIAQLFHRSIVSTYAGRESSRVANFGRSAAEEIIQAPFNSQVLTIDSDTEEETIQVWIPNPPSGDASDPYLSSEGRWEDEADAGGADFTWRRTIRVRQYSVSDLLNDGADSQAFDEPLEASTLPNFVHLKEVEVEVEPTRSDGALGAPKRIVLRTLKAF